MTKIMKNKLKNTFEKSKKGREIKFKIKNTKIKRKYFSKDSFLKKTIKKCFQNCRTDTTKKYFQKIK